MLSVNNGLLVEVSSSFLMQCFFFIIYAFFNVCFLLLFFLDSDQISFYIISDGDQMLLKIFSCRL